MVNRQFYILEVQKRRFLQQIRKDLANFELVSKLNFVGYINFYAQVGNAATCAFFCGKEWK